MKRSLKQQLITKNLIELRKKNSTGLKGTRIWRIWCGMKTRCNNPKCKDYPKYGGAGIRVCEQWNHFRAFWEDMKLGYQNDLQLDRIDNTKGYSKENCRWVTVRQQQRNRRSNVLVQTPKGPMLLIEASEVFGIPYGCLKMRHRCWPENRLLEPKRLHIRK